MRGYLLYVALTALGLVVVVLPFLVMRNARRNRAYHAKGLLLTGPLHFYLAKRRYTLTKRELFLAAAVVLLGLVAPLLTYLLEG
jgi:hypothetical protein